MLPEAGLFSTDLVNILNSQSRSFRGVYACDKLPSDLCCQENFSIVVNLSPHTEEGSHWISIISTASCVIYADSFGLPPMNKAILNFLLKCNRPKIYWVTQRVQADTSQYCGYYCILYIIYFEKLPNFTMRFTDNYPDNDRKCIAYLQEFLKINI